MDFKSALILYLKGVAMGAADVVPGVSGGTVAFISGIYERLLNAIKSVTPSTFKLMLKEGVGAAWAKIDGTFLVILLSGIATSLFTLAKGLSWALEAYPQLIWSFFFGLVIASTWFVGKSVSKWNIITIASLIVGTAIAYIITILAPTEATTAYWMVFLSGAIAICAMILPGISGSFILLLMGMYAHVLGALNDRNILFLAIFASGCLIGILLFSHVLSWTFKHYYAPTLALLTGFMIGSLNKVWPWQNVTQTRIDSHGEEVPMLTQSVLPSVYEGDPMVVYCLLLLVLGFLMVYILEKIGSKPA
jgi:putative membrane protein